MNHAKGFIKAYDYNEAEVYQGFSSLNWGHALCVGNGDIGVVRGDTLCVECIVRGGGVYGGVWVWWGRCVCGGFVWCGALGSVFAGGVYGHENCMEEYISRRKPSGGLSLLPAIKS